MNLEHPPAEIVSKLLRDLGLATRRENNQAWPVFVSFLPANPDDAIAVFDTSGKLQGRIQRTGETITKPGIQVRVRAKDYKTGWKKINTIRQALDAVLRTPVTVDGRVYTLQSVTLTSDITPIGQAPDSRRDEFTLNATLSFQF